MYLRRSETAGRYGVWMLSGELCGAAGRSWVRSEHAGARDAK